MARVPSPRVGAGYRSGESLRQTMGYTESGDICYLVIPARRSTRVHAHTTDPTPVSPPPAAAAFR
jgi:hypothetical protein